MTEIIIDWVIAHEGRNRITGTALFTEARRLCSYARAVCIEPKGNI